MTEQFVPRTMPMPEAEPVTQRLPHPQPCPQACPQPGPPSGPPPGRRGRGWLIGGAAGALALVGVLVAVVVTAGGAPATPTAAAAPTTTTAAAPAKRGGRGFRLQPGERMVRGVIGAIGGDSLTITPAAGPPVGLTIGPDTRVIGAATPADLKPGERVAVIARGGAAVAVRLGGAAGRPTAPAPTSADGG